MAMHLFELIGNATPDLFHMRKTRFALGSAGVIRRNADNVNSREPIEAKFIAVIYIVHNYSAVDLTDVGD